MSEHISRQTIVTAVSILIALVWLFAYALPKIGAINRLTEENARFSGERQNIFRALTDYSVNKNVKTAPTPNAATWITQNALSGLQKNLDSNNPYKNSQGSQIKLRGVTADQVTAILSKLSTVNLIVKSLKLQDLDGDGKWNLEMAVEVPS